MQAGHCVTNLMRQKLLPSNKYVTNKIILWFICDEIAILQINLGYNLVSCENDVKTIELRVKKDMVNREGSHAGRLYKNNSE